MVHSFLLSSDAGRRSLEERPRARASAARAHLGRVVAAALETSRCPRWHEACSRQEVQCRYGGIAARAWLGMDADETFGSPVTGRDRKRIQ